MSAGQTNSGAINNPAPIIAIPAIVVGCGGQCKTWVRSIFIKKSEGRASCGDSLRTCSSTGKPVRVVGLRTIPC